MCAIRIENISLQYEQQVVLDNINLDIHSGEFICLLGPSGSGKSSLLRLVSGLANPSSGKVFIDNQEVTGPGLDRGVVFQEYSLFPWMSIGENILLGLEQANPKEPVSKLKVVAEDFLNLVGLPDVYNKMPSQLSGGMRQRAAIARAFAMSPPILLMDEPFGALDAVTRAHLQDLVLDLWQQNKQNRKTIVFVTHDVEEALLLASQIVVLNLNPGTVKEVVPVSFPRPRVRQQLYHDEQFLALRNHLVTLLNEAIIQELALPDLVQADGDRI